MKILINEKQLKNLATHLIKEQKGEQIYDQYYSDIDRDKAIKLLNLDPKSKVEGDKIINVGEGAKILFQIERVEPIKEEDYPKAELYLSLLYKYNVSYISNVIKSLPDLYEVVKKYIVDVYAPLDLIFEELPKDEYSIVFQDSKWIIVVPHTERASCWLGVNTQWCTTYGKYSLNKHFVGRNRNEFQEYNAQGNLYIIINKQDENEKYQFHLESSQFNDKNDEGIDPKLFYKKNKSLSNFFKKIGDDLIEQYVDGDLNLVYLPIISLGKLEYMGGDLGLTYTQIKSLGNLKRVGGDLDLWGAPITSLENLEYVGGDLDLRGCPITSLGNLEYVGGDLDLWNTPTTSLGNLKRVGGYLDLRNTQITSMGKLEHVVVSIYIENTPLSQKYSIEQLEEMYPQFIGKFVS